MTGVQSHGILNKQKAHSVKKVSGVHFFKTASGTDTIPLCGVQKHPGKRTQKLIVGAARRINRIRKKPGIHRV